jgi:hypothetical protein
VFFKKHTNVAVLVEENRFGKILGCLVTEGTNQTHNKYLPDNLHSKAYAQHMLNMAGNYFGDNKIHKEQ